MDGDTASSSHSYSRDSLRAPRPSTAPNIAVVTSHRAHDATLRAEGTGLTRCRGWTYPAPADTSALCVFWAPDRGVPPGRIAAMSGQCVGPEGRHYVLVNFDAALESHGISPE